MRIREFHAALADTAIDAPLRCCAEGPRRAIPSGRGPMVGPFVLLDRLGPAVFGTGGGLDVAPHPHIGLAAVTFLVDGELVHRDNLGHVQTIRPGEVNWITAGSGIVHSERTSVKARASGSNLFGVEAWIALPAAYEETAPDFAHYAASAVPRLCAKGVEFTLIAGACDGLQSPVHTYSDIVLAEIVLTGGATYQVKPGHAERAVYILAGQVEIVGVPGTFGESELTLLKPGVEVVLRAPAFHAVRLMLVGGEPLSEPRHIYWNFVSSSAERIEQAKMDWRDGRFPKVPGEDELSPLPEDLEKRFR